MGAIGLGLGLTMGRGSARWSPLYLLRDEFTTDQAAPLTSPRTCEPGPGTITIVDSGNVLSISGGKITRSTAAVTSWLDPRIYGGAITRAAGMTMKVLLNGLTIYDDMLGWRTTATGTQSVIIGALLNGNSFQAWTGPTSGQIVCGSISSGDHVIYIVLRSIGSFIIMDGKLMYVNSTSNAATMYPSWQQSGFARTSSLGYLRVWQLPAPWNSDWGIATGHTASPVSGASLTHEADCLAEVTWTASAGVTLEMDVRRTDADNRWIVRCDQAGGTIKLIERNAAVETERSSAAQTWTAGSAYRIVVMATGTTIRTVVISSSAGANKNTYTSATFNQTATVALVTASVGALADFATWPYSLSGTALSILEAE